METDDAYRTTQMIAVDAGEPYFVSGNIVSTYDKWGNFISRISNTVGLFTPVTFDQGVTFVRLSYLASSYMYFEY